jgi:hypothetical protein
MSVKKAWSDFIAPFCAFALYSEVLQWSLSAAWNWREISFGERFSPSPRATSSAFVAQEQALIRIALSPRHSVSPHQHSPLVCTSSSVRR